jgi:hypothetical protein
MEVSNYLVNISLVHQNETVAMVFLPVCLEIFNIMMLTAGMCLLYLGIEISHPVYGLLFSNLIVTTISSLINVFVFPFVKTIYYNTLINGNNAACLNFHCCSWCILSVLRYLYIIHKSWLDKTFPKLCSLFILSIVGVLALFLFGTITVIALAIHLGWPDVKLMKMPPEDQLKFVGILLGNYTMLLSISCFFYVMILRKRGQFGHNRVNLENNSIQEINDPINSRNEQNLSIVDDDSSKTNGTAANDRNEIAIISTIRSVPATNIATDDIELKRQMAEIESAIKSLKTNLILTSALCISFISATVISNTIGSVVFTFLKGLFPILTTISNFNKVQDLLKLSSKNIVEWLSKKRQNIKCCH